MWVSAVYGVPVVFGPNYFTQQESCRALIDAGVGFEVSDAANLGATIDYLRSEGMEPFKDSRNALAQKLEKRNHNYESFLP